ncbi:MAG: hypothetical protein ACREJB_00490 [Planctomycetaceae bacterium]
MRILRSTLDRFRDCWRIADDYVAAREAGTASAAKRARWALLRKTNNQAYFMLMFAAFEEYVGRRYERCRNKNRDPGRRWMTRRAWEVLPEDPPFKIKLGVLTEKAQADYSSIVDYYKIRNDVAHGNFTSLPPIFVPDVHADLLAIANRLSN